MKTKLFEIRDEGTCIPAVAMYVDPRAPRTMDEDWLLKRAGWSMNQTGVYLGQLAVEGKWCFDAYSWGSSTMRDAHLYIEKYWHSLTSGQVIDVRCVRGETKQPCESDRLFTATAVVADPTSH